MLRSLLATLALFVLPAFSLSMKPPKAEWISLTPWSSIQPPRSGHVAFTAKDRLFLFGGYAEDEDLHRYVTNDLWEWKDGGWEKQKPSGDAHPRLVSSSVVMNDRYVVPTTNRKSFSRLLKSTNHIFSTVRTLWVGGIRRQRVQVG